MYMWRHAIKPTARVSLEFAWRLEGALTSSGWWWASEIIGSHYHVTAENKPAPATQIIPNHFPPPLFQQCILCSAPRQKGASSLCYILYTSPLFADIIQLLMMKRAIGRTVNGIYWTERGSRFYFFRLQREPNGAHYYTSRRRTKWMCNTYKELGWDPPFWGSNENTEEKRETSVIIIIIILNARGGHWTPGIYYTLGQSQHEIYTPLPVVEP